MRKNCTVIRSKRSRMWIETMHHNIKIYLNKKKIQSED